MTSPGTHTTAPVARPTPTSAPTWHVGPRRVVTSAWLFAILCYLYCDMHSLFDAEVLKELTTGRAGGIELTQGFLLGSSVLMSLPIGATLVTRVAPHHLARWTSVAVAALMTVVQTASLTVGSAPAMFYLYFSALEISTTAFIAWYAITRWRVDG